MESGKILPSIGKVHARYGNGQYFTDLKASDYTAGQILRRLYRVPWNTKSITNYIQIDIKGLNIIQNAPHNYSLPNNEPFNINGRVVNHGITIFKIKF